MCSLFGILNYTNSLNQDQINTIIKILASECEVRGIDATGIAYNHSNRLEVFKRPLPSHKIKFNIPKSVTTVMGHTRLTTQGLEKYNFNNHPFLGKCNKDSYALAHNGIIYNDDILRDKHNLRETHIETDTYIVVQLIDNSKYLNLESIAKSVEELEGYFSFTILDDKNNLYIVKGESPLAIYHFKELGFYIYASTKEILDNSLKRLGIHRFIYTEIKLYEGDIIRISNNGEISEYKYTPNDYFSIINRRYNSFDYGCCDTKSYKPSSNIIENSYYKIVVEYAKGLGFTKKEIDLLIDSGFEIEFIEELLNDPNELSIYISCLTVGGNCFA